MDPIQKQAARKRWYLINEAFELLWQAFEGEPPPQYQAESDKEKGKALDEMKEGPNHNDLPF